MHRKEIFGFKSDTAVLTFTFLFLSSHLFSLFLAHLFFSFAGHLVGFILVGKNWGKAFRILGLDERKGRWVVEQDFHGNFQVNVTWFFAFFSGVLDWIVLILVWFERSLHYAQVSRQSCPWPLKLMSSQVVERTWIRTGGCRQLRGKWVNNIIHVQCTSKKIDRINWRCKIVYFVYRSNLIWGDFWIYLKLQGCRLILNFYSLLSIASRY